MTLQEPARIIGKCVSLISRGAYGQCAASATEALCAAGPRRVTAALLNVRGVARHLNGEWDAAHDDLLETLTLVERDRGGISDAYVDLGGVLADLAANQLRYLLPDTH